MRALVGRFEARRCHGPRRTARTTARCAARLAALLLAAFAMQPTTAAAPTPDAVTSRAPFTLPLWPGAAPGSEHWTQKEIDVADTPIGRVAIDVVTPTLTVYLPQGKQRERAGVLVVPGGAFVAVALGAEGDPAAAWLLRHGVAAFVLKYRTVEKCGEGIPKLDQDAAARWGTADALEALKLIRRHARAWGLDPRRIGVLGFSAGGMIASETLLAPAPAERPAFAALIYGAPFGRMPAIPSALPPVFMAWAQDDPMAAQPAAAFAEALRAAGQPPDVHVYASGGHAFAFKQQGTPSDKWTEAYAAWLASLGAIPRGEQH